MNEPSDSGSGIGAPPTPDEIASLLQVEHLLDQRWPETRIDPSLTRISALMDLLGSPQLGYPSIHIAGTNGKTSVARMIDALVTALQRRTGEERFAALAVRWWDEIDRYFLDRKGGGWWQELAPDMTPATSTWSGKPDVYHSYQALLFPSLPLSPTAATAPNTKPPEMPPMLSG